MVPLTFLPLNTKIDGQTRNIRDEDRCLRSDQARFMYKKVDTQEVSLT